MSPFLEKKYNYTVFETIDNVRNQLKSIVKTPWYDIAINFRGRVFDNNTFKLYSKMAIGFSYFGMAKNTAMITGKLESNHEQTNIQIEIKPTIFALLAFYVMLFILIFKLFDLFIHRTQEDWIIIVGLFFLLIILRSVIYFSIGTLKNRFERVMGVHAEE